MAHKHLQRRIDKWVRSRGMHVDEDSMAESDSLKAAMQPSFEEPDEAPPFSDIGLSQPGSPGASTTATSIAGASTVGPSSINKRVSMLYATT